LGRAARSRAGIRVRQPLGALLVVAPRTHIAGLGELVQLVADELNVKEVRFVEEASRYVTYEVRPRFDRLGPRLGPRVQAIASALAALGPEQAEAVAREGRVTLTLDGETVVLGAEDLEIRPREREGFVAEAGSGVVVILDTHLTPELLREGLMRELVHHVQQLRRDAGLAVDQRIELWVEATGEVAEAVEAYRETLAAEVLAVRVELGRREEGVAREARLSHGPVRIVLRPVE
ncbi:MAG: DUF5915 domain-containing protein, partial [Armatimonadota bacterium]|nr:DUF5915 domain-containing protein [Armatimonadota bacterium]